MTAWLYEANALDLPIDDNSVDLVVTSPPYYALRSYQDDGEHFEGQIGSEDTPDEFLDALWAVTRECVRVLKPSGSLWVNLGDKYSSGSSGQSRLNDRQNTAKVRSGSVAGFRPKSLIGLPWRYALGCIDDLGLILRAEVVWSKPNPLPESVKDRVRRSHEQWFHFTLEPRYFSAIDEIREPWVVASRDGRGAGKTYTADGSANHGVGSDSLGLVGADAGHPLGKVPGSVWSIPSEPLRVPDHLGVDHFAAFPQEWPRRLILGWCPAEVCTACGEGRAPVVERENLGTVGAHNHDRAAGMTHGLGPSTLRNTQPTTITGYACACSDTTAPSTPGVVLDPFCGTGTVPMVAHALGRTGIGVDLSGDYLRLARWRVFESGHAQKSIDRTAANVRGSK